MSLSNIKTYLQSRLDGLGYTEWRDGFASDNIPETIVDRSYHILVESIAGGPINHTHQDTAARCSVKIIYKGYRDVAEAVDTAILGVETIVKDVCKLVNRTSLVNNVIFTECILRPQSSDNDNSVLAEMVFEVRIILDVEN